MMKTKDEKFWWLQVKEAPRTVKKVKLSKRADGWVCLESAGPVQDETGFWGWEAYALKESEFNVTWRTWNGMPTRAMMERPWNGWQP